MGYKYTDCSKLRASDREDLFGKGFAAVHVIKFGHADGICITKVVVDGHPVTLVGDPEQALHAHMLGGGKDNVKGCA